MSDESGWVVEPAGVEIHVAVGPEAELTPEVRQALDQLVRALEAENDVEVEGFRQRCPTKCMPGKFGACNPQEDCSPKIWFPCAMRMICNIVEQP